jgi:hypothetical protein
VSFYLFATGTNYNAHMLWSERIDGMQNVADKGTT